MAADIETVISEYKDKNIALYGLGTETERFLTDWGNKISVTCLLDGFREEGEVYGYPILPHQTAIDKGVSLIIVIARPGSCKAITKRIGNLCRENGVALFDVRGRNLLVAGDVAYDFSGIKGESREVLLGKIKDADVVSFDLFDTLVERKVYSYTDIFDLVDIELRNRGIVIPDFAKRRLFSEKELSKETSPILIEIYKDVIERAGVSNISAGELSDIEWKIDCSTLISRDSVRDIFKNAVDEGKRVVITSDSYYRKEQIEHILSRFGISGYEEVFVSCEYGTFKTQKLFDELMKLTDKQILHIGDDEFADIEMPKKRGIGTFRVYSATDLMDELGGMGTDDCNSTLSDRIKVGLFASRVFNNPFCFEDSARKLAVNDAKEFGYLFCAPMITDFVLWMRERIKEENFKQVLFGARDGYFIEKLYRKVDFDTKAVYFLTSRTAAIRAGMESEKDIDYVNSMKYFGTEEEAVKTRFGISASIDGNESLNEAILNRASVQKINYQKYIEKLKLYDEKLAMFDFVAKGTTQMYLNKLFSQHLKGFYFLQLEPEFMADKGLDIEPFYSDEEKEFSAIYDNYYILETMLTAPYPQLEEFGENGEPKFAKETRSESNIRCFVRAQRGIEEYFDDYISILPEELRAENKRLDEIFLSLVNRVQILDEDFMALKVEDPFFGRMTDITDVIG